MIITAAQINEMYANAEQRAKNTPNKLFKVHSGVYLAVIQDRLWKFSQLEETPDRPWIAESGKDYTDTHTTLKQLKKSMGVSI